MPASPILQNLSGLTFLMPAETGIIKRNFGRNTEREFIWVYDSSQGFDIGFVAHNPAATYNLGGFLSGDTGVAAAAPGIALTIADTDFGNGVGTDGTDNGTVWTLTTALQHGEKNLREFSVTARQAPGVTAA